MIGIILRKSSLNPLSIVYLCDINVLFLLQVTNMLEPIVLKGTRWVLRREGVSNHSDLSDFLIKSD